jgi:hypothetical protein
MSARLMRGAAPIEMEPIATAMMMAARLTEINFAGIGRIPRAT